MIELCGQHYATFRRETGTFTGTGGTDRVCPYLR
jgi:hypothetical protein